MSAYHHHARHPRLAAREKAQFRYRGRFGSLGGGEVENSIEMFTTTTVPHMLHRHVASKHSLMGFAL